MTTSHRKSAPQYIAPEPCTVVHIARFLLVHSHMHLYLSVYTENEIKDKRTVHTNVETKV